MRKYIKFFVPILFLVVFGWLSNSIYKGYINKKKANIRIQTLPNVEFSSLNRQIVNLHEFNNEIPLILIYFHPECEHCSYEAKEIVQNATIFNNTQVVMVTSDDSIQRIETFCNIHHLWELENIEVLLDKNNRFKKTFGKAIIPTVYIYGKRHRLVKEFYGETKPEAIINQISRN